MGAAVAATAALAGVAGWTQSAATEPAGAEAAQELTYTTKVVATDRPEEIRAGDQWYTYHHVYDARGKKAGDGSAQCTAVRVTRDSVTTNCLLVLRTDKGKISLAQMEKRGGLRRNLSNAPVIGGTGAFATLRGPAAVDHTVGSDTTRYVFRVS